MKIRNPGRSPIAALLLASAPLFPVTASAQTSAPADPLEQAFNDPPASARPRVWWHWMNGNITKDGIEKDLDWMKRVGIGGVQAFDVNLVTPQVVDTRLVYMTPAWKDAFRFAATRADQLGLELAIASSPGWSATGGPWVPPQDAMKKLVWSETTLPGGKRFAGALPAPPGVTGAYQALPMTPDPASMLSKDTPAATPQYYADVAVLAYPIAPDVPLPAPRVTSDAGDPVDAAALLDDDPATTLTVRGAIRLDYGRPQTVRSARIYLPNARPPIGAISFAPRLETSEDGHVWRPIATFDITDVPTTVSFAPVTARLFRIVIAGVGAKANDGVQRSARIGQFALSSAPRIDRAEAKAGFSVVQDYYALTTTADPRDTGVAPGAVIDVTRFMRSDGTLDWTPPKGSTWRVVRFGTSLLGTTNHPATAESTGLETDKYDAGAVHRYLDTYLGMYRDTVGADLVGKRGIRALLTDSIEVGASNWTPRMIDQFKRLRGYDPTPWLPALTGVLIGNRAQSDAFLYDYRRTLADLIASEHYGTLADVAHQNGLIVYGEALEDHRPLLGDDMAMRSHTDIPTAAMWTYPRDAGPKLTYLADIKGAASIAHLYGQNLVAAESLTASRKPWAFGPADLRPFIDLEFATGVNRPVIHTSVHQPLDKPPGLSLYFFGQYFNRLENWAEMAKPWVDYMSRNSLMLQQGRDVADVAYFYGEEAPLTGLFGDKAIADAPTRYGYDFVNPDALNSVLSVENGVLTSKSGAHYRALYLGGSSRRMTLATLRRIAALAEAGATVIGDAPTGSPSLNDDPAAYRALMARLWSGGAVTQVGAGRVIAGQDVEAALSSIGIAPDFAYAKPAPDSQMLFAHRHLDDGDAYFVDNRQNRPERIEARFRVAGKTPEIWRADSGVSSPVSYRIDGDETVVPLAFDADESYFVVFRKPATAPGATVRAPELTPLASLDGSWDVAFQPGRGAPAATKLAALGSLSDQAEPGIKYFSGTATYTKRFTLPKGAQPGAPLLLDLGQVGDVAEVRVNGRPVGTAWHAPYRLDIGSVVKRGANTLEIRVADLWVNRLIGDQQPGAQKITFTTLPTYSAVATLRPSGLIGPVQLIGVR